MIKIRYERRCTLHAALATITRGKIARALSRLGEPFIQHLVVLIASALLAMSLGCTLFFPQPSTTAGTRTRTNLLCQCQLVNGMHEGQQGQEGTRL